MLYADACARFPEGQEDVDAWLAGEVMPSEVRERRGRVSLLAAAGAEVVGETG